MNVTQSFWNDSRQNFNKVYLHNKQVDYEQCVNKIQSYIADNSNSLYDKLGDDMTHDERRKILVQYIREYLFKFKPIIGEYVQDGKMNYSLLENRLIDEITNHGILTPAMTDDAITEIRINSGATPGGIWVEKEGLSLPLTDPLTGSPVYFKDNDEVSKFINNILKYSKISMSVSDALVNGTTIEGYRIAATDAYATARTKGVSEKSATCVIRKFSGKKYLLPDLVKRKTLSTDMAKFLALLPKVDLTAAVIGSTGSGKTITLQAILEETPYNKRIVLIQNPAEIDMHELDESGKLKRDVISWEAKDLKGELAKKSSTPTYSHLMDHSLRYTPQVFVFGELRNDEEFALSLKAANTGHHFYTTFHSETSKKALNRYTSAAIGGSGNGMSKDLILETVCESMRFITSQKRLPDGTRKIIGIDEICGVVVQDGFIVPVINEIFKFIPLPGRDADGFIRGAHAQVGTVSESTLNHLLLSGATEEDLEILNRKATKENPIIGVYEEM